MGAVILNRVRHPSFPKQLRALYISPLHLIVVDGQIHANMVESCVRAARDALNGWDPTGNAIYYYNPRTATNQ